MTLGGLPTFERAHPPQPWRPSNARVGAAGSSSPGGAQFLAISSCDGLPALAELQRQGSRPAQVKVRDPLKAAQLSVSLHPNSEPANGVQVADLAPDQLVRRLHIRDLRLVVVSPQ